MPMAYFNSRNQNGRQNQKFSICKMASGLFSCRTLNLLVRVKEKRKRERKPTSNLCPFICNEIYVSHFVFCPLERFLSSLVFHVQFETIHLPPCGCVWCALRQTSTTFNWIPLQFTNSMNIRHDNNHVIRYKSFARNQTKSFLFSSLLLPSPFSFFDHFNGAVAKIRFDVWNFNNSCAQLCDLQPTIVRSFALSIVK